jgi:hypothetical protein
MTEKECAEYCTTPVEYERFKLQNNCDWAYLLGFGDGVRPVSHRRVIEKIADNIHE